MKRNILFGVKGKDRYTSLRAFLLESLKGTSLFEAELAKKGGFAQSSFLAMYKGKKNGRGGNSQTQKCIQNLISTGIIEVRQVGNKRLWSLCPLIEQPAPLPQQTSPTSVNDLFQAFMKAIHDEAEKAAQHKINSQKAAIDGYVAIIKKLQEEPLNDPVVEKLFNFKSLK